MPIPPRDYVETPDYICTCRKCGSSGKVLPRATWYDHNPGGKRAKRPGWSREQIEAMGSHPAPVYSKRRKRRLEEDEGGDEGDHPHVSKRATGSSSVRM